MIKIIKYNDLKFDASLKKIIQFKRMDSKEIKLSVSKILNDIKTKKDIALFKYAKKFDNVSNPKKELKLKSSEIKNAKLKCSK